MKVLVTGASGFIGGQLRRALAARGHEVLCVSREKRGEGWLALDVSTASTDDWREHLRGVDAVVNAVGIFRESPRQTFQALHVDGPKRLFEACAAAGVDRVVQLSALGADTHASTGYHRSKFAVDEFVLSLPLDAVVLQPSLVFGMHGASARMFLAWASLPLIPLPAGGGQRVQPLHVDDLVELIIRVIEQPAGARHLGRIAVVGPAGLSLAEYLQGLRSGLHLRPAPSIAVPAWLMSIAARMGDTMPALLFNSDAWKMLQRGNEAPVDDTAAMLGRLPKPVRQFVADDDADTARREARLDWLIPVLRLSLALVWIVTGIVSLGLYPVDDSLDLLARAGVPRELRGVMLYGAAAFDLALGVATLMPLRHRRWLWLIQAALICFYTAVITLRLPEFWLHPYGPVLKNLPILGILLTLAMLEPVRRRP